MIYLRIRNRNKWERSMRIIDDDATDGGFSYSEGFLHGAFCVAATVAIIIAAGGAIWWVWS
jgi:hypothetical protein